MMTEKQFIEYLHLVKPSTCDIADSTSEKIAITNLQNINSSEYIVGKVHWIYIDNKSNYNLHKQAVEIQNGAVVIIDAYDFDDCAIAGELVSTYIFETKKAAAMVVCGKLRDAKNLKQHGFPIWCDGFTPVGCLNKKSEPDTASNAYKKSKSNFYEKIAVCDENGIILIPNTLNLAMLKKSIDEIGEREKRWFNELKNKKMNTFEIVCK